MNDIVSELLGSLKFVSNCRQLENWVRFELRRYLPHASFLVTLGKTYSVGSVPTHRVAVDFPLALVEDLKDALGAINDPLLRGWFQTGRYKYSDLESGVNLVAQVTWIQSMRDYGFKNMIVHGIIDKPAKRFATFQIVNLYHGGSFETAEMLGALIKPMAAAAWATVDCRTNVSARELTGHPTLALTVTEIEIVELLARGMSNKEIARYRGVSDSTVKTQVSRTGAKVGATRRAEIVAIALPMLSLLPPHPSIYDDY